MNTRLARPVRKFNPGTFQSDEEIKQQFVVRQKELRIVADVLRSNIDSASCQHVMIVAPRGRGKTMLLARLSAELRTAEEFERRLLPVRFMEESLEVFDEAGFWLEAMFQLAQEITGREPDLANELRTHRSDLLSRGGTELAERAFAAVVDAANQLGRRLVLMVENMQNLCKDADQDLGWALRRVLQTEPQIMLVSTATTRFQDLDKADGPFFELFRDLPLRPLDTEECRRLWTAISGDVVTGRAIRPLEILTGGNPRLLVIVAQFSLHRSLKQLMEELVTLVDDHTEYFRGHLEAMVMGERRVYIAVIDLWQPSSTGEVAARARMGVRKTSVMLGRLLGKGLVVFEGTGNRRRYSAAEPLYAIYYKLRRERDEAAVVVNLIRFMAAFYTNPELATISDMLVREAHESPSIREGLVRALDDAKVAGFLVNVLSIKEGIAPASEVEVLIHKAQVQDQLGNREAELTIYEEICGRFGDSANTDIRPLVAWAMLWKAVTLGQLGQPQDEVAAYESVDKRFGDDDMDEIRAVCATACFYRALTLGQLSKPQDAVATCDAINERFGDDGVDGIRVVVAKACFYKALTLAQLDRAEDEVAAYEAIEERFGNDELDEVRTVIAKACYFKALTLSQLERPRDALTACKMVDERFGREDAAGDTQEVVARALVLEGLLLASENSLDRAVETFAKVEARYGGSSEPMLQVQVAKALASAGLVNRGQGHMEGALHSWVRLVDRYGASEDPDTRDIVATTLVWQAITYQESESFSTAERLCDDIEQRFGSGDTEDQRKSVAKAWLVKGRIAVDTGREGEGIRIADEIEGQFGTQAHDDGIPFAWRARHLKAIALARLRHHEQSVDGLRSAYGLFVPKRETIQEMVGLMVELVSNGVPPADLLDVIAQDDEAAASLEPLKVALAQECGLEVRAPEATLEVAADIRTTWGSSNVRP